MPDCLDVDTIPEGFKVLDPSKLTKKMVSDLWSHWSERAEAELPIFIFIKAREQDLGRKARGRQGVTEPGTVAGRSDGDRWVTVWSDEEQSSDGDLDEAYMGEGTSGPFVRPPPSKCPRISGQLALSDGESPAAHNSNRLKFLCSLSLEASYKTLLDGVSALPVSVSPFPLHLHGFV
jgi:hypothetical protein